MKTKYWINKNDGRIVLPTGRKGYHTYIKSFGGGGEIAPIDMEMRDLYIEVACGNVYYFVKQSDCIELEIE